MKLSRCLVFLESKLAFPSFVQKMQITFKEKGGKNSYKFPGKRQILTRNFRPGNSIKRSIRQYFLLRFFCSRQKEKKSFFGAVTDKKDLCSFFRKKNLLWPLLQNLARCPPFFFFFFTKSSPLFPSFEIATDVCPQGKKRWVCTLRL